MVEIIHPAILPPLSPVQGWGLEEPIPAVIGPGKVAVMGITAGQKQIAGSLSEYYQRTLLLLFHVVSVSMETNSPHWFPTDIWMLSFHLREFVCLHFTNIT